MKIAFLNYDVKINDIVYRAKKKNVFTYDSDGNIISTELKTMSKAKYDVLDVESLEAFNVIAPNIFIATENWEIEPDALPN